MSKSERGTRKSERGSELRERFVARLCEVVEELRDLAETSLDNGKDLAFRLETNDEGLLDGGERFRERNKCNRLRGAHEAYEKAASLVMAIEAEFEGAGAA